MKKNKDDGIFRAIQLSLLEKSPKERLRFSDEVKKILTFVSEVQSVDTKEITDGEVKVNIFRDDAVTVKSGAYRAHMLEQAPNIFKNWFLSKKILQ